MRIFQCPTCGQPVHFDNNLCTACGSSLGYIPEQFEMIALEDGKAGEHQQCANASLSGCNWLVEENDEEAFCKACRLNLKVPDLSDPQKVEKWSKIEAAKRHFLYGLMRLGLPIISRSEDSTDGLAFQLLSEDGPEGSILTGHDNGLITINIAEADSPEREARREALGEDFRTLLGHFRHESGHYYWNMLVRDQGKEDMLRAVFGDERVDYGEALQSYYDNGPSPDWQAQFISAYASSHAWEDFAETWAHYLHILDGLETAFAYGLWPREAHEPFDAYREVSMEAMCDTWVTLSVGVNAINRSVGQPDLYPFVFSAPVREKLDFIHHLVDANRERNKKPD